MVDGRDLWMAEPESFTFDLNPDENYEGDEVFVTWLQRGRACPPRGRPSRAPATTAAHIIDYAAHRITIVDDDLPPPNARVSTRDGVDDGSWRSSTGGPPAPESHHQYRTATTAADLPNAEWVHASRTGATGLINVSVLKPGARNHVELRTVYQSGAIGQSFECERNDLGCILEMTGPAIDGRDPGGPAPPTIAGFQFPSASSPGIGPNSVRGEWDTDPNLRNQWHWLTGTDGNSTDGDSTAGVVHGLHHSEHRIYLRAVNSNGKSATSNVSILSDMRRFGTNEPTTWRRAASAATECG